MQFIEILLSGKDKNYTNTIYLFNVYIVPFSYFPLPSLGIFNKKMENVLYLSSPLSMSLPSLFADLSVSTYRYIIYN